MLNIDESLCFHPHPYCHDRIECDIPSYTKLREDLKKNGLKRNLVIHEGMLFDGWPCYMACRELGIKPTFERADKLQASEYIKGRLLSPVLISPYSQNEMFLKDEEYEELKKETKIYGQQNMILINRGLISRGLDQFLICLDLMIIPLLTAYISPDRDSDGDSSAQLQANRKWKAPISDSEKVLMAAQATIASGKDKMTVKTAAKIFRVAPRSITKAKRIILEYPEYIPAIVSGETTISTIDSEIRKKKQHHLTIKNSQ